jgi:hypothetical protein
MGCPANEENVYNILAENLGTKKEHAVRTLFSYYIPPIA